MTKRADDMPLYPSEKEIARAVLGADRAHLWPSIAAHDEQKHGLPKIDAVRGGRYWPAVKRFYDLINGLDERAPAAGPSTLSNVRVRIIDTAPDGHEDFHAEKDAALRNRRSDRRAIRQRA